MAQYTANRLEKVNHASTRMIELYDGRRDEAILDEVECIML